MNRHATDAYQWAHRLNERAVVKTVTNLDAAIKARVSEIQSQQKAGFADWISKSLKVGAGAAHKWTTQRTKAPPLPNTILDGERVLWSPLEKIVYYREYWSEIWRKELTIARICSFGLR